MDSNAWDEEEVFHIARKLTDPADRAKYLDQVCGNDLGRRQRIEAMLEVYAKDRSFLKSEPAPTVQEGAVNESPGSEVGPYNTTVLTNRWSSASRCLFHPW